MPTWVARRQTSRTAQNMRNYLSTDGERVFCWDNSILTTEPTPLEPAKTSEKWIRQYAKHHLRAREVAKAELEPGQCYPRIWRGERHPCAAFDDEDTCRRLIIEIQAADLLLGKVRDVFGTVHPAGRNRHAYGHEIRSLLILACTEVESAWKAVLRASRYVPPAGGGRFWTTKDYVKLERPMRLREWAVAMPLFPDYGAILPFRRWKIAEPTASLRWYAAYNAAKHDREESFAEATLGMLVESAAAVFVMMAAQVGPRVLCERAHANRDFVIWREPNWGLSEEYVPPISGLPSQGPLSLQRPRWNFVPYPFR